MNYVSTGGLPRNRQVQTLIENAYQRFGSEQGGSKSTVYPALAAAADHAFGICLVSAGGDLFEIGDTRTEFTLMSVSKPFTFAILCNRFGPDRMREMIGMEATGMPFNSVTAIERGKGLTNPMVNPGAIAVTSLCPGQSLESKWDFLLGELSSFAGEELKLDEHVFQCAMETNFRNRSISRLLQSFGRIYSDPDEALELYTRQCSLSVSAYHLASMAATLADGGMQPITLAQVVQPMVCHYTLASMVTAGLYERSGSWLYEVGLPGKSGISGGMITVSPGKGALGTYAPLLDEYGNSVKGQRVAGYLSQELGLDLFISQPIKLPRLPPEATAEVE